MTNRQIDPSGPYNHGYQDAELGLPIEAQPYLHPEQRRAYEAGYRAAKLAEKSPL